MRKFYNMYSTGSCGVAILDLRSTTKKSTNIFRGSNKGHTRVKFPLNVFLSRRIMKFQPLGKHNWPIGHLKFTNDMIITNDVEEHSSKMSPKFGKVNGHGQQMESDYNAQHGPFVQVS